MLRRDPVPACGSKEDPKCDAHANRQEQRGCRAEARTILSSDGERGSPDAGAGRVIYVPGSVVYRFDLIA